jgi:hypothetical protein
MTYADKNIECWHFSSEEKANEVKDALVSTGLRDESKFLIFINPIDVPFDPNGSNLFFVLPATNSVAP